MSKEEVDKLRKELENDLFVQFKMWTEHIITKLPEHKTAPETREMINGLKADMQVIHSYFEEKEGKVGIVPRIEKQACKTNGRVSKIEMKIAVATGAIIILSGFSGWFGKVLMDYSKHVQEQNNKIIKIESYFEKQ